jgi:hypothetical protein
MGTLAGPPLGSALLGLAGHRSASDWLVDAVSGRDATGIEGVFDEATRRVGTEPLSLGHEEREHLRGLGVDWSLASWAVDDAVRAALLVHAAACVHEDALQALVERRWGAGDGRQRCAILHALPLLPSPERFLGLALQARRGAVRRVFEALACDNPYPATHFHDVHFTDMVAAALEADFAIERIVGLDRRITAELTRAGARFAAARRAAGRSVPVDLWRLTPQRWSAA